MHTNMPMSAAMWFFDVVKNVMSSTEPENDGPQAEQFHWNCSSGSNTISTSAGWGGGGGGGTSQKQ